MSDGEPPAKPGPGGAPGGDGPIARLRDGGGPPTPRQVSLARLKEFGVTPKRDLGQNFLIDDNILSVILGQLDHRRGDVALEVGAGLGVLTGALAEAVRHVHAFEVDRSLEAPLRTTLADHANVSLHFEDVLRARLELLDPTPTICASNLPYSVAGPFVIEVLQRLPEVRRYCVMVQREVAERMTAAPRKKSYGVLSIWVQLYAEIVRTRPLSRSIFYPRPHVDSSLVVFDRRPGEQLPACDPVQLRVVLQAAFGQRRKMLVNALATTLSLSRETVLAAMSELGVEADARAEQLEPRRFVELATVLRGVG